MGLTLGNNLTGLVSREVDAAGRKASNLGESLTTGNNKLLSTVDSFLGNSLNDNVIMLGAVAKSTAYSTNMLSVAGEYFAGMGSALQGALTASTSASQVAPEKIPTLQASLNDKLALLERLATTADFDGYNLGQGEIQNKSVQVGLNSTDTILLNIKDVSAGKLLRSSVTTSLNDHIAATPAAQATHYVTAAHLATDLEDNVNLVHAGLTDVGGAANGVGAMSDAEFDVALVAVITAKASFGSLLNEALPVGKAFLIANQAGNEFTTLAAGDITAMMGDANSRAEMLAFLKDGSVTDVSTASGRASTQDVVTNALQTVRKMQSDISNQRENIVATTEALKATTNVTSRAADSYIKTDYVQAAQEFSETIKSMTAAISSLQAMNKVSDAAMSLTQTLAR